MHPRLSRFLGFLIVAGCALALPARADPAAERIKALEARIQRLEARLAALEKSLHGAATAKTPEPPPQSTNPADPSYYFGVWRSRIPGAVWTSPSGYQGYDWLHVGAGVSTGDLIIRPDGTYVWNSYGGKSGKWIQGDRAEYPIVLIDTVENRRWVVGADPKREGGRDIIIWSGSIYYDGRR